MISKLGPRSLSRGMNIWPPFLGAGIKVRTISPDWTEVIVTMNLRWYNKNYFSTHFGGSLFSMTDPFFALMVIKSLGRDYHVWDKSSEIEFVKPGRGRVTARFRLEQHTVSGIRSAASNGEKHFVTLPVEITDEKDDVVARINKTLYVRLKSTNREPI